MSVIFIAVKLLKCVVQIIEQKTKIADTLVK